MAEADDILGAIRLRNEDAVESRLHNGGEILQREAGVERVDSHEEGRRARFGLVQQTSDMRARLRLLSRRDRILEVEYQRVRAGLLRLRELPFGIAGHEQERAQPHAGFLSMRAARRQEQTTSLR